MELGVTALSTYACTLPRRIARVDHGRQVLPAQTLPGGLRSSAERPPVVNTERTGLIQKRHLMQRPCPPEPSSLKLPNIGDRRCCDRKSASTLYGTAVLVDHATSSTSLLFLQSGMNFHVPRTTNEKKCPPKNILGGPLPTAANGLPKLVAEMRPHDLPILPTREAFFRLRRNNRELNICCLAVLYQHLDCTRVHDTSDSEIKILVESSHSHQASQSKNCL